MFLALNNRFDSRGLHCARDMLIFLELEHVGCYGTALCSGFATLVAFA